MELHDDLKNFPNLQHLLGTGLYTELFDDQASSVTDNEKPEDPSQISEDLPFPADTDTNILPSDYQYVCQQSQLKGHGNPQTFHGLSVLQFGLHPNNFQSFQAMACPLNIDAYPEPVFDCDCGEKFDNLGSMITHRENDIQHKPWHGIWKVQGQGVCLCGRCFTNEPALRRHIRMANASIRRQRWVNGERDTKQLQIPALPKQKDHGPRSTGRSRGQEEAAKLRQHIKDIDKLIVEGTMRQLVEEKDGIAKAKRRANGKISQKQRKQLEREKAKK